jgi:hypothetical protein
MSEDVQPAAPAPPKSGVWKSLVFGAVGVIAIIIGVSKMTSGLSEMFGGGNEEVMKLLAASDEASVRGLEAGNAGDLKFNELLGVLNAETLDALHADHAAAIDETVNNYAKAVEDFGLGADKLDEALKLKVPERLAEFLKLKSQLYRAYAEAYGHRHTAATAMKDTAITDKAALVATISDLAPKADAAIAKGDELAKQADVISKELTEQK